MTAPDVIKPSVQEKIDKSKESKDIDEIIDDLKSLSEETDIAKSKLYKQLGNLQEKLDSIRDKLKPEEYSYFDNRLRYVERLISDLSGGKLSIDNFKYDPKIHAKENIKFQKHLSGLISKFGVNGLELVEANGGGRGAINYGLQLNGKYLGTFEAGTLFSGGNHPDSLIAKNIKAQLDRNGIRYSFAIENAKRTDVINKSFPVDVDIEQEGLNILNELGISIATDGRINGATINNQAATIIPETTKRVMLRVQDADKMRFSMFLDNTDGTSDYVIFEGQKGTIK